MYAYTGVEKQELEKRRPILVSKWVTKYNLLHKDQALEWLISATFLHK